MIQHVLQNLEITHLNPMQEASLKAADQHADVLLLSPTGSGKTLAFLLPLLRRLKEEEKGVQALILAPARELALQIEGVFRKGGTGFKVNCCYGGHSMRIEQNNLSQPPAVLVGTPGRIADHLRRQTFDPGGIRLLVIDEFDKALELGFEQEMAYILGQLPVLQQRIFTSATNLEQLPAFAGLKEPAVLNFLSDTAPAGLQQRAVRATGTDKLEALFNLICTLGDASSLVFCNHREAVDRISDLMIERGIAHGVFHGGMEQDERERELIKFRNGSHRLLITTDLASRGLDIPEIEHVMHYQLPQDEKAYVHRNGRTARMKAEGTSWLVLAQDEPLPSYVTEKPEEVALQECESLPPKPEWNTLYIGAGKKDKVNKIDVVGLLLQKGGLQKQELGLIEVLDKSAFAAVKRSKAQAVVHRLRGEKIKNKKVKIALSK